MLNRLPAYTPSLSDMLADIGSPAPAAVAAALGVSPRTVRRWLATGQAPRAAALAVFSITRWGLSLVESEAQRRAQLK